MKKETRKKLIWKENSIWKTIPMVMIAEALQKQKWFKGESLYYTSMTNVEAKKFFVKEIKNKLDGLLGPPRLFVYQYHKGVQMEVRIVWDENLKRCGIYLKSPMTQIYYPGGSYRNPNMVNSRYLEGVLERIEEAFDHGIPKVERDLMEEEAKQIKIKKANEYKENLSDELGVVLKSVGTYRLHEYEYGRDKSFGLCFERNDPDEDVFQITEIRGDFSKVEIKQLIKIIGGNPKAIADRLTGKK